MTDVILTNTEQTTVTIEYDLKGKPIPEAGLVPVVSVDATDKLTATLNPDNLTIQVVTIDDAIGAATLTVTATLPDGIVLTETLGFMVVAPEADAITLTAAPPTEKPVPVLPLAA